MNKILLTIGLVSFFILGCSTDDDAPEPDKCSMKNIVISDSVIHVENCKNNGTIIVTATGSTDFTYKLNNGDLQVSNRFDNLSAGTYEITVRDFEGCERTQNITVNAGGAMGDKFSAVKALVAQKCAISGCHAANGTIPNIFSTDCKIVERGALMKTKAVDSNMGNLSTNEKSIILAWLNAGGKFTD
ncbi:MAG: hypothetical protein Q8K70_03675 [Bacteroidota bacterium]|nr:hypothetical protein [Bacteroidota bacterium]